jgi:hypothetical protein
MWVQVDFGRGQTVESVVLEASNDQGPVRLKLEGEVSPGVWAEIAGEPAASTRGMEWDLRRAAVAELRARGITHLMVSKGDSGSLDFSVNPRKWDLEPLGTTPDGTLYRLGP